MGSSFNNFTSELTGSIIHERVDSINYGEQVTSSTVNSLVRWQIKQFTNHTIFSYSRFNKQLQPEAKKQSYHNLTCTLASAKYLLSVYVQPNLTCTWFEIAVYKIRSILRDVRGKVKQTCQFVTSVWKYDRPKHRRRLTKSSRVKSTRDQYWKVKLKILLLCLS